MATHVSLCDRATFAATLHFGDQSWGAGAWSFHHPLPGTFACTVRTLPEEQNEPDAAFSLCHTHSAITLWTWWGEEEGG